MSKTKNKKEVIKSKSKNKTGMIILTCLIAASFSISTVFTDNIGGVDFSNDNVAWSGNLPIKNTEFLRYKQSLSQENPNITNKDVIEKIAERYSIIQYAENQLNIVALDENIIKEIKNDKKFQVNGVFVPSVYEKHLKSLAMTPQAYEKNVRENLQLNELILLTKIRNDSKKSQELLMSSLFETLDVDIYEMSYTYQDDDQVHIDLQKLRDYYKENTSVFNTNLSYNVEIEKYNITNEFRKSEWERFKKNPDTMYDIQQIVLNSEEDLEKAKELIKTKDFGDIAELMSIDKSSASVGGLIKDLKSVELTPDFKKGLVDNEVGGTFVAKSSIGYHLVKKVKGYDQNISFEDFKDKFNNRINSNFRTMIENKEIKYSLKENMSLSESSLYSILKKDIKVGDTHILGDNESLERLVVSKENSVRKLNIKDQEDMKMITLIYKNHLKLKNAISLSIEIEKGNIENMPNWILHTKTNLRKDSKLDDKIKDAIFTSPVGKMRDLLINDKYFVFKINKVNKPETKTKEFSDVINRMYDYESGALLINEAKKLYPIKMSKKLL